MLVSELIELLNQPNVTVNSVAMPKIGVGEKKVRQALKQAGAVHVNRQGWQFNGDKSNLDRPIYDFIGASNIEKPIAREVKVNAIKNASKEIAEEKVDASDMKTKFENVSQSDLDKIDVLLGKREAPKKERVYKGYYFDKDIIEVIDNVKHGNKSDLVNEMIRLVLKDRGLL